MNDAAFVRGLERVGDLAGDFQRVSNRERPHSQAVGEHVALDEFEDQGRHAIHVFQPIDGADVRMIERREQPCFALEAGEAFGIAREDPRQNLDGDVATQLRVVRSVHFAHAAGAELRLDDVRPQVPADERGALTHQSARERRRRCAHEARGLRLLCEQRLDLPLQRGVAGARLGEKRGARGSLDARARPGRSVRFRVRDQASCRLHTARRVKTATFSPRSMQSAPKIHRLLLRGLCGSQSSGLSQDFSSRSSHSFANRQSRFTVSGDTCNASAASSTLNPPKNRSSTT